MHRSDEREWKPEKLTLARREASKKKPQKRPGRDDLGKKKMQDMHAKEQRRTEPLVRTDCSEWEEENKRGFHNIGKHTLKGRNLRIGWMVGRRVGLGRRKGKSKNRFGLLTAG